MADRFKRLKSVDKGVMEQMYVYSSCLMYSRLPAMQRRKIDNLCLRAGGESAAALKCFLTTDASWQWVTLRYHISPSALDRMRREFYRLF